MTAPEWPRCPEGQLVGLGECPACVAERTRWDRAYSGVQEREAFALHDERPLSERIAEERERMKGAA